MADDNSTRPLPMTVGLCRLIEDLQLQIPEPARRSEIVAGARKTFVADGKILEQYPKDYAPKGLFGDLRFALRYEPIALDAYSAIFLEAIKIDIRRGLDLIIYIHREQGKRRIGQVLELRA